MDPKKIARLISEDIRTNNGFLFEDAEGMVEAGSPVYGKRKDNIQPVIIKAIREDVEEEPLDEFFSAMVDEDPVTGHPRHNVDYFREQHGDSLRKISNILQNGSNWAVIMGHAVLHNQRPDLDWKKVPPHEKVAILQRLRTSQYGDTPYWPRDEREDIGSGNGTSRPGTSLGRSFFDRTPVPKSPYWLNARGKPAS